MDQIKTANRHLEAAAARADLLEMQITNSAGLEKEQRQLRERNIDLIHQPDSPAPDAILLESIRAQYSEAKRLITQRNAIDRSHAIRKELDSLPIVATADISELDARLDRAQTQLDDLKDLEKAANQQRADARRIAEAQEALKVITTDRDAIKLAKAECRNIRDEITNAAFGPLLQTANRFVAGILPTPLEYRDGEIGRYQAGAWVPVRCFGGTMTAITHAGLQAALSAGAPVRLLIVDEMGRFDLRNKAQFMANVADAIRDGIIEQFVGIDTCARDYDGIAGLTHISIQG
jgi:hypothetical protein